MRALEIFALLSFPSKSTSWTRSVVASAVVSWPSRQDQRVSLMRGVHGWQTSAMVGEGREMRYFRLQKHGVICIH